MQYYFKRCGLPSISSLKPHRDTQYDLGLLVESTDCSNLLNVSGLRASARHPTLCSYVLYDLGFCGLLYDLRLFVDAADCSNRLYDLGLRAWARDPALGSDLLYGFGLRSVIRYSGCSPTLRIVAIGFTR